MQDQAVDILKQLGFSSYEAKAYIGLLEHQPVGAYELAKRTQIPTSKIYETINKLLNRDVILIFRSRPDRYRRSIVLKLMRQPRFDSAAEVGWVNRSQPKLRFEPEAD